MLRSGCQVLEVLLMEVRVLRSKHDFLLRRRHESLLRKLLVDAGLLLNRRLMGPHLAMVVAVNSRLL